LVAAALPDDVAAIVSRGGRARLAGAVLPRVKAPTLLIIGGAADVVIRFNQQVLSDARRCDRTTQHSPGAGHLFEEQGALERVADLAITLFPKRLS